MLKAPLVTDRPPAAVFIANVPATVVPLAVVL